MKVLVTGASGFLGQRVVEAFVRGGHSVRALIRSRTEVEELPWGGQVELCRGDMRAPDSLAEAVKGVDAVVHLAGSPEADPDVLFAAVVVGTEHLVAAMARAGVRRLVLASSFAVYDPTTLNGVADETAPLEADPYSREGYTVAKLWQERVARRGAAEHGLQLTVLRPGLVWGPGREEVGSLGVRLRGVQVLFGARSPLRLTFVDNCADCFVAATVSSTTVGETMNVVDGNDVTAWRYAGELRNLSGSPRMRLVVPYSLAFALVRLVHRLARAVLGDGVRLPGVFMPRRFEARFKPLHYRTDRVRELSGWTPKVSFEDAAARSFPAAGDAP